MRLLLVVLLLPLFVFAQATSSDPGGVIPGGTSTSPLTPGTTTPAPVPPTQTPRPTPTPETKPTSTESPQDQTHEISNPNAPVFEVTTIPSGFPISKLDLLLIGGSGILAGLGAFALRRKKQNKIENSDEEEKPKCDEIKSRVEKKLRELTDLQGHVKGIAMEKTESLVKGVIKKTPTGVLLIKIEEAQKEYERLKKILEECEAQIGKIEEKILKFNHGMVSMILSGEKYSTIRLFDDKNLAKGDKIVLWNRQKNEKFARAKISDVVQKKLGDITASDLAGHEKYGTRANMLETFRRYYGQNVTLNSPAKIIRFEIEK